MYVNMGPELCSSRQPNDDDDDMMATPNEQNTYGTPNVICGLEKLSARNAVSFLLGQHYYYDGTT